MLKEHNNEQLRQKGIKENVIPFYQIWTELVNEKTMDVYQYRILTSLSALEELAEVLKKTISGVFVNDANVKSCREETLYILNSDMFLEKYYKAIRTLSNQVSFEKLVNLCNEVVVAELDANVKNIAAERFKCIQTMELSESIRRMSKAR